VELTPLLNNRKGLPCCFIPPTAQRKLFSGLFDCRYKAWVTPPDRRSRLLFLDESIGQVPRVPHAQSLSRSWARVRDNSYLLLFCSESSMKSYLLTKPSQFPRETSRSKYFFVQQEGHLHQNICRDIILY
jgi:hypothetical protein